MELSGQGEIDQGDLASGIQKEAVGTGMVDGYGEKNLVAVDDL